MLPFTLFSVTVIESIKDKQVKV